MVTMRPAKLSVTDFACAKRAYRGMSKQQEQWEPRKPLFDSVDGWEKCAHSLDAADQLAYEHVLAPVLNLKWEHAVSFSCSSRVARHYALSANSQPYSKEQGFVGIFQRAPVSRVHVIGGSPFLYICEDETVWLDPRNISPATSLYSAAPIAFEYARDCACVDDELLLVFGKITASKLLLVKRIPMPEKQHEPWQRTVNTKAPHMGLPAPQTPPFTEMLRHRDQRRNAAVLASVLGG